MGKLLLWTTGVAVGVIVLVVLTSHTYRIPSSAMEPTLRCGKPGPGCSGSSDDRILVPRFLFKSAQRGDLIAFKTPPLARVRCGAGGVFVKRVVGLPGERIGERSGTVVLNGRRLREPYVERARRDNQTYAPRVVAAGAYFVLGDNRAQSCDSRAWGSVVRSALIGEVFMTYWPPNRISFHFVGGAIAAHLALFEILNDPVHNNGPVGPAVNPSGLRFAWIDAGG